MNMFRVLTILTVLSFLSPCYYNMDGNVALDSGFSDESFLSL